MPAEQDRDPGVWAAALIVTAVLAGIAAVMTVAGKKKTVPAP